MEKDVSSLLVNSFFPFLDTSDDYPMLLDF